MDNELQLAPHRSPSVSLTPLIDVVFILLVFFMLATRFSVQEDLAINIQPGEPLETKEQWLQLTVNTDGALLRDAAPLSEAQLIALQQRYESRVHVSAEPSASLQQALTAVDLLKQQNWQHIQLDLLP